MQNFLCLIAFLNFFKLSRLLQQNSKKNGAYLDIIFIGLKKYLLIPKSQIHIMIYLHTFQIFVKLKIIMNHLVIVIFIELEDC